MVALCAGWWEAVFGAYHVPEGVEEGGLKDLFGWVGVRVSCVYVSGAQSGHLVSFLGCFKWQGEGIF